MILFGTVGGIVAGILATLSLPFLLRRLEDPNPTLSASTQRLVLLIGGICGALAGWFATNPHRLALDILVIAALLNVAVCDVRLHLIPDIEVLPLLALLGGGLRILDGAHPIELLYGGLLNLFLWGLVWLLGRLIFRQDAVGLADVSLCVTAGIILGPFESLVASFVGIMLGGVASLGLVLSRKQSLREYIAYGPFLCVGIFVCTLFGP